jgi:deoxyribose-phosphate aldolase
VALVAPNVGSLTQSMSDSSPVPRLVFVGGRRWTIKMASPTPLTIKVSLPQLAKLIDHALLQPTLTDAEILTGLQTAKQYNVATACIKPYSIPAVTALAGSSPVLICSVIGFPHGNSTTEVKVFEARSAVEAGAHEIDMVVNGGKVLGGDWGYVEEEI